MLAKVLATLTGVYMRGATMEAEDGEVNAEQRFEVSTSSLTASPPPVAGPSSVAAASPIETTAGQTTGVASSGWAAAVCRATVSENVEGEMRGLEARLAAADLRERHLRGQLQELRVERDLQTRAAARAHAEVARLRGGGGADVARLRSEGVRYQREAEEMLQGRLKAEREASEQRRAVRALERVCMGLRERVARAEVKAQRGAALEAANMGRDAARAALGEVKAACEELRGRAAVAEAARDAARDEVKRERARRDVVEERARAVEAELAGLRATVVGVEEDRRKLKEARKAVKERDVRIRRLVRAVGAGGDVVGGGLRSSSQASESSGTSSAGSSRRSGSSRRRSTTTRGGGVEVAESETSRSDDLEGSITSVGEDAVRWGTTRRKRTTSESGGSHPGASPLLRAVERAHAELKAAFQESDENAANVHNNLLM